MMAKKKPDTESIRVSTDLTRRARVVAAARGISLPAYLEEKISEIVERDLPDALRNLGMPDDTPRPKKK